MMSFPAHYLPRLANRGAQACTSKMNLADEVDLETFVSRPDKISNADIAAICLEAGMQAVRKNRYPLCARSVLWLLAPVSDPEPVYSDT